MQKRSKKTWKHCTSIDSSHYSALIGVQTFENVEFRNSRQLSDSSHFWQFFYFYWYLKNPVKLRRNLIKKFRSFNVLLFHIFSWGIFLVLTLEIPYPVNFLTNWQNRDKIDSCKQNFEILFRDFSINKAYFRCPLAQLYIFSTIFWNSFRN
jgi:hypothetical protein